MRVRRDLLVAFGERGAGLCRKLHDEGRATADLALHLDRPAMTLKNPKLAEEPQPVAHHAGLRREDRLEDPAEVLRRDPVARVVALYLDRAADTDRGDGRSP